MGAHLRLLGEALLVRSFVRCFCRIQRLSLNKWLFSQSLGALTDWLVSAQIWALVGFEAEEAPSPLQLHCTSSQCAGSFNLAAQVEGARRGL